jgi:ligand-binding sensor domain-containing protein
VNALCLGPDGALWVGTGFADLGGAARFEGEKWVPLLKRDGLAGNKVRSLFVDRGGVMYFGSEYDGLAIHAQERWRYLDRRDGLAGKEIKAMLQDADGIFWLGTDTGLSRMEGLSTMGRGSVS